MVQAGQRLGEYILIERIGSGAFGDVWRAHHHAWIDSIVAIKIPTDPQYIQCLQREGAAIRKLAHPNIVSAIAFDPFGSPPYLAMEFVPGGNLRQRMERGRIPIPDTLRVMRQILAGLQEAHRQGIIHRDIKPENILLQESNSTDKRELLVKITDFGLGNAVVRNAQSILMSQNLSQQNMLAGTQAYMAPEQAEGAAADPRVDLYACGVVYFEMLTGRRPVGHELPSEFNNAVPKWMDTAFQAAYARLDKRVASAEAFAQLLVPPGDGLPKVLHRPPPLPVRPVVPHKSLLPPSRTVFLTLVIVAGVLFTVAMVILELFAARSSISTSQWDDNHWPTQTPVQPPTPSRGDGSESLPAPQKRVAPPVPKPVPTPTPPRVTSLPPKPAPPTAPAVAAKPAEPEEIPEVVRRLRLSYAELFDNTTKVELVAFHDASDMRRHAGGPAQIAGAYSKSPVAGANNFIMFWGIYEQLPPAKYLIVYRVQAMSEINGENICFLDVCTNGNTIASRRPPAGEFVKDGWKEFPIELNLKGGTTVEYRLWPNNNTIALDRIYVFKIK